MYTHTHPSILLPSIFLSSPNRQCQQKPKAHYVSQPNVLKRKACFWPNKKEGKRCQFVCQIDQRRQLSLWQGKNSPKGVLQQKPASCPWSILGHSVTKWGWAAQLQYQAAKWCLHREPASSFLLWRSACQVLTSVLGDKLSQLVLIRKKGSPHPQERST